MTLENSEWLLSSVSGRAVEKKERPARLMLDSKQGRAFGFAGCNEFSARYRASSEALTFTRITYTRKGCADADLAKLEDAYLAALSDVRSWMIKGTTLSLQDAAGRSVLTFEWSAKSNRIPKSP
jgi:heat shock protein HslJ